MKKIIIALMGAMLLSSCGSTEIWTSHRTDADGITTTTDHIKWVVRNGKVYQTRKMYYGAEEVEVNARLSFFGNSIIYQGMEYSK